MVNFNYLKNTNITWYHHKIRQQDREQLHNHSGLVLLFTGLSGSGKSTLANALEQVLYSRSISTYLLDGDNIRHGLCCDLDFSDHNRREHIRRVGEVAKLMLDAGLVVLAALISPFRSDRLMLRNMFPVGYFIEVFVDTPLSTCEIRDPKGLYKKVRAGNLKCFTGVDATYEIPCQPDIHIDGQQLLTTLVDKLLNIIKKRIVI